MRQVAVRFETVAPWLAIGAVGMGVYGVVREMTRRARTDRGLTMRMVPDRCDATPPHGDKLLRQPRGD